MNIGFGSTVLWHELEGGNFFCPACGSERSYLRRQSRRWVRFIVPILPKETIEDVYECQGCHREFDDHVITTPPTSDLATRLQRTTRIASVLAILNGDPYHQPSRAKAVDVVRGAGMRHYSDTDLDADLRSIDVAQINQEAHQLTIDLDLQGREHLLVSIGQVVIAAGPISETNRSMLHQLGRSLEVTPGTVHRILAQLDHEATMIAAFDPDVSASTAPPPPPPA